ncbi:MAG: HAD-IA family hydrolase [Desulfobacterales bacterium]|nr:HAD-IA family hydrolase [Desulfobacterales bacterium]
MTTIKVVVFDCDGVMFDTHDANMAYYNDILSHFGRPSMTCEQFSYSYMHTAEKSLAYLIGDPKVRENALRYCKAMDYAPFIKQMRMNPELKPLLRRLRSRYKIAVATNRTETMARVMVEHNLEAYFDFVVCALDVRRPKPYPDPLEKILDHFKVSPEEALFIGDSKVDEKAASACGVSLAAFNNPSLNAEFHISSLLQIEEILNDLHARYEYSKA